MSSRLVKELKVGLDISWDASLLGLRVVIVKGCGSLFSFTLVSVVVLILARSLSAGKFQ